MSKAFTEITRLSEKDCFHIVERHKSEFPVEIQAQPT